MNNTNDKWPDATLPLYRVLCSMCFHRIWSCFDPMSQKRLPSPRVGSANLYWWNFRCPVSPKLSHRGRSSLYTSEAASASVWRWQGFCSTLGRRTSQGQEEPARSCKQFRIIWTFLFEAGMSLETMLLWHEASKSQRCGLGATEKKSFFFFHAGRFN